MKKLVLLLLVFIPLFATSWCGSEKTLRVIFNDGEECYLTTRSYTFNYKWVQYRSKWCVFFYFNNDKLYYKNLSVLSNQKIKEKCYGYESNSTSTWEWGEGYIIFYDINTIEKL